MRGRAWWATALGWFVGGGITAWILWGPYLFFAYPGREAHLVLDTADACVALLGAFLAHGRFVRAGRWQDLLLAQSLLVLAVSGAVSGMLAGVLPGSPGATDVWMLLGLRTVGALLLLAASLVGPVRVVGVRFRRAGVVGGRVPPGGRPPRAGAPAWVPTVGGPTLVVVAAFVLASLVGAGLPVAVDTAYLEADLRPALLTAHPVLVGAQLLSAVAFLVASVAFTRQGIRTGDTLLRWLGPASALGGFARVNYALAPSLYTDWLYTGDLLRTGFYLLLLVGAARELSRYWTSRTEDAVLADRRRLARELHDGVVQELSYIRGESHAIQDDPGLRERILGATDRGLDEARAAIHALGQVEGEPFAELLHRAAHELGRRHRMDVVVDADPSLAVEADQVHTLLRIVREAVTNAARHGRAEVVRVELRGDGGARLLRVCDDGVGFDVDGAVQQRSGYGLVSIDERARALPGTLDIASEVGVGSEVSVRW
ncbi:sensor histidine kinase [Ornithinimicrobium sp. W1679]|uniref:sensor histidine kinase n=1 Tax=Ornithinimicrobium sp. W1679 TaxID=3418770 RepID=UPI003CEACC1A